MMLSGELMKRIILIGVVIHLMSNKEGKNVSIMMMYSLVIIPLFVCCQWEPVEYFNNKIICDLIEARPMGIIAIMVSASTLISVVLEDQLFFSCVYC